MAFELSRRGEAPPPRRTAEDNHATLLVSWWCTLFALVIILTRLVGRLMRTERLFREDKIMALSIIPLMIRMALVHPIMLYGTNNAELHDITQEEIYHRTIGSKLVLASRIFYAMFIWTAKFTVSEFLKRITSTTWNRKQEIGLKIIRGFLVVTFIGVVIGTLAECQPFYDYWQVVPDPGPLCRNGYAQLLTMGISDIITDVLLVVFPMPIIMKSGMPISRKISLCLLFSLSLILLAIAAYRMPAIISVHGLQQRRTLWASIEILAAAAVSNSIIIGSFVRDKGVKKNKYKKDESVVRSNSAGEPSMNRVLTQQHWGNDSDADLFRSVGGRMNSIATESEGMTVVRAAQQVDPLPKLEQGKSPAGIDQDMSFYEADAGLGDTLPSTTGTKARHASQQMTFYDIGGILDDGSREITPQATRDGAVGAQDFARASRPSFVTGATSDVWGTPPSSTSMHDPHDPREDWPLRQGDASDSQQNGYRHMDAG